ncbi:hypothetical protein NP493_2801g00000 [Ridgeia piscesae]|uniref:Kringle domain-containing protein n=1 Tax=Ridgeia piscesae TaxID=27915 RepID=A0AAD9N131_RIDPI|nr:hypothetical protein NP493_2801g00000 [Ridgeia piscesae]
MPGYFGGQCQFRCQCRADETCNDVTGQCPSDCPDDRWGVGCILNNNNYYNDAKGTNYMGKKAKSTHDHEHNPSVKPCIRWIDQDHYYSLSDGSRAEAKNYCRNPTNSPYTWCYYNQNYKWNYCQMENINCVTGRFDVNCKKECHCSGATEDCQKKNGVCQTECAPHFQGSICQECKDGYFGTLCDHTCHCRSGSCDKTTGHCPSGCATGWTGDNCQTGTNQRVSVRK